MKNYKSKFKIFTFYIVILIFTFSIFNFANADTNIDATYRYAWNDVIGWIDFYSTNNVNATSTQLSGYASSSVGYIALDCATSPNGDICATSNFKVANDGSGNLSGWAWNDAIGWISFNCSNPETAGCNPGTGGSNYQVTISPSTGDFSGWAWNDIVGWISFNCNDINNCDTAPNHKVKTAWRAEMASGTLISSIFDTQATNGVAINTIMWQGNKPSDTNVKFQIASSNSSSGPWSYLGPDGSDTTYYTPTDANMPVQINSAFHNNHRYFRYKIFLTSNASQTESPRVDDVIINWSP